MTYVNHVLLNYKHISYIGLVMIYVTERHGQLVEQHTWCIGYVRKTFPVSDNYIVGQGTVYHIDKICISLYFIYAITVS